MIESVATNGRRVYGSSSRPSSRPVPPPSPKPVSVQDVPDEDGRVRVFIRFRDDTRSDACVTRDPGDPHSVVYVPSKSQGTNNFQGQKYPLKVFSFDGVLESQSSQAEVYTTVVAPIVERFLQGYNVAVLAYGQSGSGKTYTIEGVVTDANRQGVVPRAGGAILRHMAESQSESVRCNLEASMIEVYCERLRDLLLNKESERRSLRIREGLDGNTEVEGATRVPLYNESSLLAVMLAGQQRRTVGETALNANSSRSHSVLCLTLTVDDLLRGIRQKSSLFFVDLAGSERVAKSRCEGVKFEEGKNINQSLTVLGIVINALASRDSFVPYRDSKLTRILRGALGGNSLTALICCVSCSRLNEFESLSTLKFGQRSSCITNTVFKESAVSDPKNDLLVKEIDTLTTYATSLELWIQSVGLKLPADIHSVRNAALSLPDLDIDIAPESPASEQLSERSSCDVETVYFPPVHSHTLTLSRIGSSEREIRSVVPNLRSDAISDLHNGSFDHRIDDDMDTSSIPRPMALEGLDLSPGISPAVALISLQRQFQSLAMRHAESKTDVFRMEAELLTKEEQIESLEESLRSAHEQYNMLLSQYERISTRAAAHDRGVEPRLLQPQEKSTVKHPQLCHAHRRDHSLHRRHINLQGGLQSPPPPLESQLLTK